MVCQQDGSTNGQPCGTNGQCNAAGNCIDLNSSGASAASALGSGTTAPAAAAGSGSGSGSGATCPTCFTNPLKFKTVDEFVSNVMGAIQKIIVSLALLTIVIGAVMYVTSAGNPKQIDRAKEAITAALIGIALGIGAPSMLRELAGILGWNTGDTRLSAAPTLSTIAINVLNFLLGTLGILAMVMIVIGAGMYIGSGGDQTRVETGKKIVKFSLIGVLISMSAMILVKQIAAFFAIR
ncbi:MAG TPA: hypothetical protein VF817_03465 [Patescibacteria group bacterium]